MGRLSGEYLKFSDFHEGAMLDECYSVITINTSCFRGKNEKDLSLDLLKCNTKSFFLIFCVFQRSKTLKTA
jgi:hypothetical protein